MTQHILAQTAKIKYKVVSIPTKKLDIDIIKQNAMIFNTKLQPNAILKVNAKNKDLQLQLYSIDITELKDTIKSFKSCKDLGRTIIKKVESIKSYGIRNGVRQYVEYNIERKVKERKTKTQKRSSDQKLDRSRGVNVQMPKQFRNKIICGDSLEVLKRLPDNCVDIIFTSPPYNFGLDYENNDDDSDKWDDYLESLFKIFAECIRVLKHGGRIAVNIQPLFSDYVPIHHIISNYFVEKGLIWKGEILWEKNNYNCKYTAWGSWKSPSSPYLKYTWEFIEVFCKSTLKKNGSKTNADISGDDFKKWVYAKWSIAPERKMKEYGHPAMFPEELAKRVLQLFSFKGDTVLDPFAGIGTTCVVAKKVGRDYLGIDISSEYVKRSKARLNRMLDC